MITQYNNIRNSHSSPSTALRNINWQQAVTASAGAGMITFVSTALMRASSHATVQALKSKIIKFAENNGGDVLRTKLKSLGFADLDVDNIFAKWGINSKVKGGILGKIGDLIVREVNGDIRKFSEYALTNPTKSGLFVDTWGYKLSDADKLLNEYITQASAAIKTNKVLLKGDSSHGKQFEVSITLTTPKKGKQVLKSSWIVKNDEPGIFQLVTPFSGFY